jgi:hypothetical protein
LFERRNAVRWQEIKLMHGGRSSELAYQQRQLEFIRINFSMREWCVGNSDSSADSKGWMRRSATESQYGEFEFGAPVKNRRWRRLDGAGGFANLTLALAGAYTNRHQLRLRILARLQEEPLKVGQSPLFSPRLFRLLGRKGVTAPP